MKPLFSLIFILTLLAAPLLPVQAAPTAPAAAITVTTTADEFGTGADCSLREAIQSANTDTAFGGCTAGFGADTITLPAGTYTLTGAAGEYNNTSGDLNINSSLTINGAGSRTTNIQAGTDATNGVDRVFYVTGDQNTVAINDVTIRYGKAPDGITGANDSTCNGSDGGGIYNNWNTTLILNDSMVIYNRAGDGGDGCTSATPSHGAGGNGGGIYASGQVELNNSGVRRNETGTGGDGPIGVNGDSGGYGGGIYIRINSVVTLTNSAAAYNKTGIGGGGGGGDPSGGNAGNGGGGGDGAGIYNSHATLALISSFVVDNENGNGGDGGDASNGNGGAGGPGGKAGGIYNYSGEMTFVVDSSIKNNATGLGGLGGTGSLSDGADSYRGNGGGLYSNNGSIVTLIDTTISGNHGLSGGMTNADTQMTLEGCTISENQAEGHGGGIYNNGSVLVVSNSTFSGNTSWTDGGAIYNSSSATASLTHVTITNNTTDYDNNGTGNGGGFYATGTFTMTNTIVAENHDSGDQNPDCYGAVASDDYNLLGIGDSTGCTFPGQANDQVGTTSVPIDPILGILAQNGGSTATHALLPGSPAIDVIPVGSCPLNVDQRGFQRPYGSSCDIGAFEVGPPVSITKLVDDANPLAGQVITFTIQVTNWISTPITGGLISDTLPVGLTFVGPITLQPSNAGTVGSAPPELVTNLNIGVGGMVTVAFPVNVSDGLAAGTVITNVASITSDQVAAPIEASASITVASVPPVNLPPIGVDDPALGAEADFITDKNTAFDTGSVLSNDIDPESGYLSVTNMDTTATLGLVSYNGDGTFNYDPDGQFDYLAAGEQATDTFTYTVSDDHDATDTATVTITITGVDDVENYMIYLPLALSQ